MHLLTTSF